MAFLLRQLSGSILGSSVFPAQIGAARDAHSLFPRHKGDLRTAPYHTPSAAWHRGTALAEARVASERFALAPGKPPEIWQREHLRTQ